MEFECFVCKLEGFTCQMNFLRLSCCSNFWHKKCKEVWKTTWSHCRRCRTQIENEEETSASQLESTEAEENPNEVLRSLLNDKQGLEELVSYTPQGYSETMLEYFSNKKLPIMCPFATWL